MCLVLVGLVAILAFGGCGSSGGNSPKKGGGSASSGNASSTSTSTQPVSTQPGPPCKPVPDPLIKQISGLLNSKIKVGDVWQMVHANKVHELGLDNPYFISARARVAPDPTTYGSWTVQDLENGTVIPLDGTAKAGTKPQKGIDPNAYEDLVTNHDYTQSRECAQAQFELMQEARKAGKK
jgi:hypothetical protein